MIPDRVGRRTARWAEAVGASARALRPDPALLDTRRAHRLEPRARQGPLGILSDPEGRRFVNALWAADLGAYPHPADQVDYPRLAWVVSVFPQGFTLWTVEGPDGAPLPVGYTGWYPVTEANLRWLLDRPDELRHRGQLVPLPSVGPTDVLYLFNYSVVGPLRHTALSRALLAELAGQLDAHPGHERAAITVSADGERAAARFGLSPRVEVRVDGSLERVHTSGPRP